MVRTVGMFGTGEIAARHAAAWSALGVGVVAYSRSPDRRQAFGRAHGIEIVDEPARLLAYADVVDICTPTDTHADLCVAAARAGRHVICEKPLARTRDQADAMIAACHEADVWLLPAQTLRYVPAFVASRESAGEIGRIETVRMSHHAPHPSPASWFADPERSGGLLVDLAIHALDYARWVVGEVDEVSAHLETEPGPRQRSTVHLSHADGARTEIEAVWDLPETDVQASLEIVGESGTVQLEPGEQPRVRTATTDTVLAVDLDADPVYVQLTEFHDVLLGHRPPRVTADDGRTALDIALTAEESARTGQVVPSHIDQH